MRVGGLALVVIGGALSGCSEEFTADDGAGGGTPSSGVSVTSGVGAGGGGQVVGDCDDPDDCFDKPGTSCVEGKCTCPSAAPDYCLPDGCLDGSKALQHCGRCDNECDSGPDGAAVCERGQCGFECHRGFADCNEEAGCETGVLDNPANCGGCGVVCATECLSDLCNDPVEIAAGQRHTCARRANGSVWCWGHNSWGALGKSTGTAITGFPVEVTLPAGRTATRIVAGGRGGCALLDDNSVFCWGDTNASTEGQLVPGASGLSAIAVGGEQSARACGVEAAVTDCWQMGFDPPSPLQAATNSKGIGVGGAHACIFKIDSSVWCWGSNVEGQLGNGNNVDAADPVQAVGLFGVTALALGLEHSCALENGTVYCWGGGSAGQLGLGDIGNAVLPTELSGLGPVDAIYPGWTTSGARVGDKLWLWGSNGERQVSPLVKPTVRNPAEYGIDDVVDAALGELHTCALKSTGELLCWGNGESGALGNGVNTNKVMPTPVNWDLP